MECKSVKVQAFHPASKAFFKFCLKSVPVAQSDIFRQTQCWTEWSRTGNRCSECYYLSYWTLWRGKYSTRTVLFGGLAMPVSLFSNNRQFQSFVNMSTRLNQVIADLIRFMVLLDIAYRFKMLGLILSYVPSQVQMTRFPAWTLY